MGDTEKEKQDQQVKEVIAKMEAISVKTGVSLFMTNLIWVEIGKGIKEKGSIGGADVVKHIISELHLNHTGDVDAILRKNGIKNSSDIGHVVFGLTDAGLLKREESDKQEDFDNHFETDGIWEYIKQEKIKKKSNRIYELSVVIFVAAVIIFVVGRERHLPDVWWMIAWILFAISAVLYIFRVPIQKMITKED